MIFKSYKNSFSNKFECIYNLMLALNNILRKGPLI